MSTRKRALVVCPGRGSYERGGLGQLQDRGEDARRVIAAADIWRDTMGRPKISDLDRAEWRNSLHVAGENASLLTATCSLADLADLDRERFEIVGVCGNSMGWYTALGAAGALDLDDTIRLVDTMGAYQEGNVLGGQLLYPVCDDDWRPDAAMLEAVEAGLEAARVAGHGAWWSIRLGGHAVLGADEGGIRFLLAHLPKLEKGGRTFPLQLPMHSAFHTPLLAATRDRALDELGDLGFRAPDVPLTDGRGFTFRPRWASPDDLFRYTLDHQVVEPYDLTASVTAALAWSAPDVVVALGPGNPLGGPLARILVNAGWGGMRSKADFEARQASDDPLLLSYGMKPQRRLLVGG